MIRYLPSLILGAILLILISPGGSLLSNTTSFFQGNAITGTSTLAPSPSITVGTKLYAVAQNDRSLKEACESLTTTTKKVTYVRPAQVSEGACQAFHNQSSHSPIGIISAVPYGPEGTQYYCNSSANKACEALASNTALSEACFESSSGPSIDENTEPRHLGANELFALCQEEDLRACDDTHEETYDFTIRMPSTGLVLRQETATLNRPRPSGASGVYDATLSFEVAGGRTIPRLIQRVQWLGDGSGGTVTRRIFARLNGQQLDLSADGGVTLERDNWTAVTTFDYDMTRLNGGVWADYISVPNGATVTYSTLEFGEKVLTETLTISNDDLEENHGPLDQIINRLDAAWITLLTNNPPPQEALPILPSGGLASTALPAPAGIMISSSNPNVLIGFGNAESGASRPVTLSDVIKSCKSMNGTECDYSSAACTAAPPVTASQTTPKTITLQQSSTPKLEKITLAQDEEITVISPCSACHLVLENLEGGDIPIGGSTEANTGFLALASLINAADASVSYTLIAVSAQEYTGGWYDPQGAKHFQGLIPSRFEGETNEYLFRTTGSLGAQNLDPEFYLLKAHADEKIENGKPYKAVFWKRDGTGVLHYTIDSIVYWDKTTLTDGNKTKGSRLTFFQGLPSGTRTLSQCEQALTALPASFLDQTLSSINNFQEILNMIKLCLP
jgi:hypothetical protein